MSTVNRYANLAIELANANSSNHPIVLGSHIVVGMHIPWIKRFALVKGTTTPTNGLQSISHDEFTLQHMLEGILLDAE